MGSGKKKIEIKRINKESRRMVTFSKRRKGLFKKADEFRAKTGVNVGILVISVSGKPYSYGDIDATLDAFLNSEVTVQQSCCITPYDGNSRVSSGGADNLRLRQWLDEFNLEGCDNVEELLLLKKRLETAKETMIRAEVESWTIN